MRKILATIITLTCLTSCEDNNQEYNDDTYVRVPKLTTITYDSCEYVVGVHSGSGVITHKGNCKFCKERKDNEKRIEDFMRHVNNILFELEKRN